MSNLAKGESEAAPKSRRLQMMARVQLDASHVSRSVTARREKVSRYCTALVVGCDDVASCYSVGVLTRRLVGR